MSICRWVITFLFLAITTVIHGAEIALENIHRPDRLMKDDALSALARKKHFFSSENEYHDAEKMVMALAGEFSPDTVLGYIMSPEAGLSSLRAYFKILAVNEQYVLKGIRGILAHSLTASQADQKLPRVLASLFGTWTPFLQQIWNTRTTDSGWTLADLYRKKPALANDVYQHCLQLDQQNKDLACRFAVLAQQNEVSYRTRAMKSRTKADWKNYAQTHTTRKCTPFYWVEKFLSQEGMSFPISEQSGRLSINFIWVGSDMPLKYANNLRSWQMAYAHDEVILWYLPGLISKTEQQAMLSLSDYAGIAVKNLQDADLSYLEEADQSTVYHFLSSIKPTSPKKVFAAVSDTMRVALAGRQSYDDNGLPKSYVYLDLDIDFASTCGFSAPAQWLDSIAFHLSKKNEWCDDVFAIRDGQYEAIYDFIVDCIKQPGSVLTAGSGGSLFEALVADGNKEKRSFPFLWNGNFNDLSYIEDSKRQDLSETWSDYYWNRLKSSN
ncbi:hypothetical protein [Endozoicomonas euniceicola]|uniref:Uncharacterized protein n=1 Tax=Endozoicomonas euniceicola TaxID=1234143 RepID=A0ABY6GZE7_9GAMM|nr:hypothetical protein [Endozoicomonas euniceicola]UYM17269.1 hypothetical protein NX720_04925 [Endozoicomonas euniceicola]